MDSLEKLKAQQKASLIFGHISAFCVAVSILFIAACAFAHQMGGVFYNACMLAANAALLRFHNKRLTEASEKIESLEKVKETFKR